MNGQVLNGTAITDTSLVDLCAFMNTASISNIPILLSAQSAGALVKAMTTSAPVQPVAVPDAQIVLSGHQLRMALDLINPGGPDERDELDDQLLFGIRQHRDDDGKVSTGMCCWNGDTDGVLPLDGEYEAPAAPAAQGDAKDAELARIKRLATCGTVDSFLLLPDQDKRYWFAMAWQESDSRKLSEERIAFLHSTNKDADGYEFGIAKVKFDATGKIESFLWGLGDNSDIDAAIAAKAAS